MSDAINPALRWPIQADRDRFYGNPRGPAGALNPSWEAANIVRIEFPWRAVLAWDTGTQVKALRIHRLCAPSLARILAEIWATARYQQKTIEQWGMHLYGGGFEYRPVRGGTSLSSHSWGCAVDFDPKRNGYGNDKPNFAKIPEVLSAFEREGWTWGGPWRPKADGMHWQAARIS